MKVQDLKDLLPDQNKYTKIGKRNTLQTFFFLNFNQLVGILPKAVYMDIPEIVIIFISRLVDFLIFIMSNPLKK